jgi:hypothetical protein
LFVNGHVYPQVDLLVAGAKYRNVKTCVQRNGAFADISNAVDPPTVSRKPVGALFWRSRQRRTNGGRRVSMAR